MSYKSKKYDLNGNQIGEVEITCASDKGADSKMVKNYIVALRENARQWSACTKDKSERAASNIKPHAQKGTGRARQGSIVSPQFRGGGRVHTPKPKFDQHVKVNQKEKRRAMIALLADKLARGDVLVLQEGALKEFESPKTKKMANFLKKVGIEKQSCLFLLANDKAEGEAQFKMSIQNLPKSSHVGLNNLNGYNLVSHQKVILMEESVSELTKTMGA